MGPSFNQDSWKKDMGVPKHNIGVELMVISKTFTWLSIHNIMMENKNAVFLTDSISSIKEMKQYSSFSHIYIDNECTEKQI